MRRQWIISAASALALSVALAAIAWQTSGQNPARDGKAAKEALVFALIGFLTVHGLPGVVASCTTTWTTP